MLQLLQAQALVIWISAVELLSHVVEIQLILAVLVVVASLNVFVIIDGRLVKISSQI